MSCAKYEELIALHVEGDLGPLDAARVDRHLAACPACAVLLEELRESQALLKTLRFERVNEEVYAAVRRRIQPASRSRWHVYAAAAAVLVALGASLLWRHPAPQPVQTVSVKQTTLAAAPSPSLGTARVSKRRRPRRTSRHPDPDPLVVKLITPDPNVVIYWLVDHNGG